jgi:2,4-dienoyl-CoA reductase-like NADH-dependent reductase (Old Yellow Enzyme family)
MLGYFPPSSNNVLFRFFSFSTPACRCCRCSSWVAPLTRFRANKGHIHGELAKTYYEQRASVPGTLIVSEASFIAPQAGRYANAPGIWSDAQVLGWKVARKPTCLFAVVGYPDLKKVTDVVRARGSFIFLQLGTLGRAADPTILKEEGGFDVVAPSPIPLSSNKESVTPRELTVAEIKEYVQPYAQAARNAMEAGLDGVEIHAANGYLLDQFLPPHASRVFTDVLWY